MQETEEGFHIRDRFDRSSVPPDPDAKDAVLSAEPWRRAAFRTARRHGDHPPHFPVLLFSGGLLNLNGHAGPVKKIPDENRQIFSIRQHPIGPYVTFLIDKMLKWCRRIG